MNPINKPAAPAVGWQQARVLEMQAEYADAFDTQTGSYDEMCAAYGEERKMWNSGGPEMEETIEYQIPYEGYTVPVRLLRPVKAEKLPVIFFMHGGGFVEGDNDTHGLVQRKLCGLFRMCCNWYRLFFGTGSKVSGCDRRRVCCSM